MRLRLRDLPSEVGLGTGGNGCLEVALRAAAAPGNSVHRLRHRADQGYRPVQPGFNMLGQSTGVSKAISPNPRAQKPQLLLTKAGLGCQAEVATEPSC